MTDVKYIDMCCEADHLIDKEMKAHQEDKWETSLGGLPHVCAGLAVTLNKDQGADESGHPGDSPLSWDLNTNNVSMSQRAGERV